MKTRLALSLLLLTPLAAQADTWSTRKCALYQDVFRDALVAYGTTGLRAEFFDQNSAFIAQGCASDQPVCARTDEELELADLLTVMTKKAGPADAFVPFTCSG